MPFLNWNDEVTEGSEIVLLPEGNYWFFVESVEKTTAKSGAPMAKLTLTVGDNTRITVITDYLVLIDTAQWKLFAFFKAIGQRESGGSLRMNWDAVSRSYGQCEIVQESYSTDSGASRTKNKIAKYLARSGDVAPTFVMKAIDYATESNQQAESAGDDIPF